MHFNFRDEVVFNCTEVGVPRSWEANLHEHCAAEGDHRSRDAARLLALLEHPSLRVGRQFVGHRPPDDADRKTTATLDFDSAISSEIARYAFKIDE